MKRFEFRLARVLKLKKQQAWLAKIREQQARAVLHAAQAVVATLEERLAEAAAQLAAQLGQTVESGPWTARYEHSAWIGRALEAAAAKMREAAEKLTQLSAERTKKDAEVEALLYLRQQQWQVHRHKALRAGQEQLDELALRRWSDQDLLSGD